MNVNNVDEAYAVLGLRTGARIQEIADAWTELTKLWDPNLHAVGSKAYEQCMRMREMTNAAYQMLMSRSGVQQAPGSKEPPSAPKSAPVVQTFFAGTPDELFAAAKQMESSNQQDALEAYKRLGQTGHLKAQFRLGYLFFYGTMKDPVQATYWWKRAAESGHVGAQFNLALMYERGMGVQQDENLALYWYTEAASRGDVEANRKLQSLTAPAQQRTLSQPTVSQQELPKPVSPSREQPVLGWAQVMKHRTGS
jgi:TPR repeat protein